MTLAEILRKSCAANKLGTTGSSAVLLARLIKSNKKTPAKSPAPKKEDHCQEDVQQAHQEGRREEEAYQEAGCQEVHGRQVQAPRGVQGDGERWMPPEPAFLISCCMRCMHLRRYACSFAPLVVALWPRH